VRRGTIRLRPSLSTRFTALVMSSKQTFLANIELHLYRKNYG
jgi:hypothetical protein